MEWGCSHTRRAGQARQGMTGEQRQEGSPGQAREEQARTHSATVLPFSLTRLHPHCQGLHLARSRCKTPSSPPCLWHRTASLLEVLASGCE